MSNDAPMPLLGNLDEGLLFVLSAPAGTGKTTLVEMLTQEFLCVKESISCTTRAPRSGEVSGEHYYFLSEEEFAWRESTGDFLEHVDLFGSRYGTSKAVLHDLQHGGKHVMLTIDTQGALKLKEEIPMVLIFLRPPSLEELQRRLEHRRTETPESIEKRIAWAEKELALVGEYDYEIVNDDLETAYQVLRSILIAEEHLVSRQ